MCKVVSTFFEGTLFGFFCQVPFLASKSIRYAYSVQAELDFHSPSDRFPVAFFHSRGGLGVLAWCETY